MRQRHGAVAPGGGNEASGAQVDAILDPADDIDCGLNRRVVRDLAQDAELGEQRLKLLPVDRGLEHALHRSFTFRRVAQFIAQLCAQNLLHLGDRNHALDPLRQVALERHRRFGAHAQGRHRDRRALARFWIGEDQADARQEESRYVCIVVIGPAHCRHRMLAQVAQTIGRDARLVIRIPGVRGDVGFGRRRCCRRQG